MKCDKNIIVTPGDYEQSAIVAQEVGDGILSRLHWMTLSPKVILNIGSKTGELSAQLKLAYPEAMVISLDTQLDMLQYAREHATSDHYLCIDQMKLPFTAHSVDLVVANLVLPWYENASGMLLAARQLLREAGVLILSAFSPDSFRGCQANVLFHEMHELGDAIVKSGFVDPVLDTDYYTFSYQDRQKQSHEMMVNGIVKSSTDLCDELQVNCEVVYAHAFVASEELTASPDQAGAAHFPLSYLRQRLRGG